MAIIPVWVVHERFHRNGEIMKPRMPFDEWEFLSISFMVIKDSCNIVWAIPRLDPAWRVAGASAWCAEDAQMALVSLAGNSWPAAEVKAEARSVLLSSLECRNSTVQLLTSHLPCFRPVGSLLVCGAGWGVHHFFTACTPIPCALAHALLASENGGRGRNLYSPISGSDVFRCNKIKDVSKNCRKKTIEIPSAPNVFSLTQKTFSVFPTSSERNRL